MSVHDDRETSPTGLWIGLAVGGLIIAYGVRGLLGDLTGSSLWSWLTWFVGGAAIHDLVLAPVVCLVAWSGVRRLPPVALGPVQAALVISGVVGLFSWPLVRAYGITPGEPSFLSRNYTTSVLATWAVVWTVTALVVVRRTVIARRR